MLALSRSYESFAEVVARANAWLADEGVDLINIETLVLPGTPGASGETATQVELGVGVLSLGHWHQAVRVWFRERDVV